MSLLLVRNNPLQDLELPSESGEQTGVSKMLNPDKDKNIVNCTVAILSVFSVLVVLRCIQYIKISPND